jgi:hypothetical protein
MCTYSTCHILDITFFFSFQSSNHQIPAKCVSFEDNYPLGYDAVMSGTLSVKFLRNMLSSILRVNRVPPKL